MQVTSTQLNIKTKRDDSGELSRFFREMKYKISKVLSVNKLVELKTNHGGGDKMFFKPHMRKLYIAKNFLVLFGLLFVGCGESEEEALKRVNVNYCEQRVVDIMNKGITPGAKIDLIKKIHDGDYKKVKGSVGCAVIACSLYEGGMNDVNKWIQGDGIEKAVEEMGLCKQ